MTVSASLKPEVSGSPPLGWRRTVVLAVAALLVLAGLLGILGRMFGLARLAAPLPAWPRLRGVPASAILLLGVALFGFQRSRRRLAQWASGLVVGVGMVGLIAYAADLPLPDGGIALWSSLMLMIGALAIFGVSARGGSPFEEPFLGIAAFILLSLSTTYLVARVAGVLDPSDTQVAGVSLQVLIAAFLLGGTFLGLIWSRGMSSLDSAWWLPIALGVATVITVLTLWRALSTREANQVVAQTTQAGDAERRALQLDLQVTAKSLHRAALWKLRGATLEQQQLDLEALQHDLQGIQGAAWLPVDGSVGADLVLPGDETDLNAAWRRYLERVGRLPDTVAYLPMDEASRRFAVVAPACEDSLCKGAMVGVVGTTRLFHSTFTDTTRGFRSGILGRVGVLEGSPAPSGELLPWVQELPLNLGALDLTLTVWPTRSTLGRIRSSLPGLVLVLGLLVGGILPLTVRLGQGARRYARDAERARLAAALERATDGIWEWDLATDLMSGSPAIWRGLEYDPNTTNPTHATWMSLVHPEDRTRVEVAIARHLSGETGGFEVEYRMRSGRGDWHTLVDRGRVVERSPSGRATRVLGMSADVTEARSAQATREMSERRFRAIFDSGFQFQLLLAQDGQVLEINRAALEETGASSDQVCGRRVWDTLWWSRDPAAQARLRQAIATALQGAAFRYEDEVAGAEGTGIILEIAVKPFLGLAGEQSQLFLEARDITARRRAEAALQEVDTLTTMGRVAARVAHEINNPLAGIQSSFRLIKGAIPASHPYFPYVGAIEREIGRIARVTRQLYETYRPEHDLGGETSIRTVLGDAVAFLEQVNRASRVRVAMEFREVPTVIRLPSSMLRQIAYNLIQNAIEASPPDSRVEILVEVRANRLELRVRDQGAGVPPGLRERIFEPFFSTKDRSVLTGGMGLGLAMVRRTVTAAGGAIDIDANPGGGSEFIVTIPLHPTQNGA